MRPILMCGRHQALMPHYRVESYRFPSPLVYGSMIPHNTAVLFPYLIKGNLTKWNIMYKSNPLSVSHFCKSGYLFPDQQSLLSVSAGCHHFGGLRFLFPYFVTTNIHSV